MIFWKHKRMKNVEYVHLTIYQPTQQIVFLCEDQGHGFLELRSLGRHPQSQSSNLISKTQWDQLSYAVGPSLVLVLHLRTVWHAMLCNQKHSPYLTTVTPFHTSQGPFTDFWRWTERCSNPTEVLLLGFRSFTYCNWAKTFSNTMFIHQHRVVPW